MDGSGPTLNPNDQGEPVKQLQQRLKDLGFDPGPVDGDFGSHTEAAVKAFQGAKGLAVDGVVGPQTWKPLGIQVKAPPAPAPDEVRQKLLAHLHGSYWQVVHECFRYAWSLVEASGGKGQGAATRSTEGRGEPITHLDAMADSGQLHVGDVVYVNRQPGADPSSTNLAYGPHWFVYVGNHTFADQYGERDAAAMQQFVPGRVIDSVFHTFG